MNTEYEFATTKELQAFESTYDPSHQDRAEQARGRFLQLYPLDKLASLTLDDYVIGKGTESFCAMVEAKSRPWAKIQGATSFKFGIYYGVTKSDPDNPMYRYANKFGQSQDEAYRNVKASLLSLIEAGKAKDFHSIDSNRLSQMFKAKILSLYFPETFLNVCSGDHLRDLAELTELPDRLPVSEYQYRLRQLKDSNIITHQWSNPKFMRFLYAKYLEEEGEQTQADRITSPRGRKRNCVNFEDIADDRARIGESSEKYALEWEQQRLRGAGYPELVDLIDDRRDKPSYGYDFLSHSYPGQERFIEVKSAGKERKSGGYRFFLSENERTVSLSDEHRRDYYFYIVFYDSKGNPSHLVHKLASEVYAQGALHPCAYEVRFDTK